MKDTNMITDPKQILARFLRIAPSAIRQIPTALDDRPRFETGGKQYLVTRHDIEAILNRPFIALIKGFYIFEMNR